MSALLELRDVSIGYHAGSTVVPAVRGVSLDLPAGHTLGLAGESGCGKSTLALAVLRLLPATAVVEGRLRLDGQDVQSMAWDRLRALRWAHTSMVFQGALHVLNPVQRIGDQVAEPIRVHQRAVTNAAARRRSAELLERVGISSTRSAAYPHELSGGQRQRVMIAMALACAPRLVIADEPTTALDIILQAQVLRLLTDLATELELGLIIISHDLSVLARACDRLAVMYAGRVVEQGPAHAVLHDPVHPYVAALTSTHPIVGDPASRLAPRGLSGDPPHLAELPPGCAFHPRCPTALACCSRLDVALRPVGDGRAAACVHVPEQPVRKKAAAEDGR